MAANIWGYDLPKSWRKDEIARSMASLLYYIVKHVYQSTDYAAKI